MLSTFVGLQPACTRGWLGSHMLRLGIEEGSVLSPGGCESRAVSSQWSGQACWRVFEQLVEQPAARICATCAYCETWLLNFD